MRNRWAWLNQEGRTKDNIKKKHNQTMIKNNLEGILIETNQEYLV